MGLHRVSLLNQSRFDTASAKLGDGISAAVSKNISFYRRYLLRLVILRVIGVRVDRDWGFEDATAVMGLFFLFSVLGVSGLKSFPALLASRTP
jgi:hypothetical protein